MLSKIENVAGSDFVFELNFLFYLQVSKKLV